jgi:hypothetical protein
LIGSIHREFIDHLVVLGEAHVRRMLQSYARYYNQSECTDRWTKMRPCLARFSGSDMLYSTRYGVASIISTSESEPLHRPKLRSGKLTLPWRAEQYNDGD